MTEPPSAAGRRAAARYLGELLLRPGRYRRLWEKFAERTRPGEINQLAVAETLAHHVYVGADGRLARTRTLQVVEAITEGLDRVPYLYDTSVLTLEVGQGCAGPAGPLYQIRDGVYAVDIPLAKSLALGETLTLEYLTTYHYPGNLLDPQECEFRRAVMGRLENFDMRVEFHRETLPAAVWWSVWDGVDGDVTETEPVSHDSQHSVHRYLRFLERTVVGFHWSWQAGGPGRPAAKSR